MLKDDGMCNHEKIVMPKPVKTEISTFDSEKSGFVVRDCDLYRLWQKALMKIKLFGISTNGTKEIIEKTFPIIEIEFLSETFLKISIS